MNKYLTIGSILLVIFAFVFVTLGVAGVFNNKPIEAAADEFIKAKTGVDVEIAEEKLLKK